MTGLYLDELGPSFAIVLYILDHSPDLPAYLLEHCYA